MTTITIDRATVEQALEALRHVVRQAQENLVPTIHYGPVNDVMNRLEAALAQQAENERLSLDSVHTCHAECQRPLCKLTRERDALLKALLRHMGMDEDEWNKPTFDHARAAIAKAEDA